MLINEARWIGNALAELPLDQISPCLNLGSSTETFRKIQQPWIEQYVLAPGAKRGIRFIHADLKHAAGVDVAGDIFDSEFQRRLSSYSPRSVLCCNMFEHVTDRRRLAQACLTLSRQNSYLIISVPKSFPYHPDPIDTYFRPSPAEIADLFPGCRVIKAAAVRDSTYWAELSRQACRSRLAALLKTAAHLPFPFYKFDRWKSRMHPLLWMFRHYNVSIVVLRRTAPAQALSVTET